MTPGSQVHVRFFRSARGLSAFFWTAMVAMLGYWVAGLSPFPPGAKLFLRCLFVVPLFCGLAAMRSAMAGMRGSGAFGVFSALSLALAGLSPFWTFWEVHPGTAYFAWNAAALCAVWLAWLVVACRLCRRYARDLGASHLATEAAVAAVLVLLAGAAIAGLVFLLLSRDGIPLAPDAFLDCFRRVAGEARFLAAMPFLVAAYTLWLAKEAGFRSLVSPPVP